MHCPSGSALFIWMLEIRLESWSLAFIQSKLVVQSITFKGVRRVKAVFLLHIYIDTQTMNNWKWMTFLTEN